MADPLLSRRQLIGGLGAGGIALAWWASSSSIGYAASNPLSISEADWRKRLGAQRYYILRQAGTERPHTSPLNNEGRRGTFACAGCSLPLFASATKFDSGTGWPSFYRALPKAVATRTDYKIGLPRTEVLCSRCGGHLGHVFRDGPRPTGLRYCMNGLALKFVPA